LCEIKSLEELQKTTQKAVKYASQCVGMKI